MSYHWSCLMGGWVAALVAFLTGWGIAKRLR